MDAKRDYYEILGVPRDADAEAIKKAFRALAVKFHPDRSTEPDAEARFKEIAEAYTVLSKPDKRAVYDAGGHAGVGGGAPEDVFRDINLSDIFGGLGFDFGDGTLDRVFGRRAAPRRGGNLEVRLVVPLATIASGGEATVRVAAPGPCSACNGTGVRGGNPPRPCETCGGTGQHVVQEHKQGISIQRATTCPACDGRGSIVDQPCPECGGTGQSERQQSLAVRIPAGIEDGTPLRIAGHGLPGGAPGVSPGDLYVVVRAAPDSRFKRRGADLWRDEAVDIADAVLGAQITVPTLDGNLSVTVPAGTQPDGTLRLAGKGLPRFGVAGAGDLYLRIKIRVPQKLSAEQRELYERLRAAGKVGETVK